MTTWDLRRHFPHLVEERTPEIAYPLCEWLLEQGRPDHGADDWLVAAFAAASGPTLGGKAFRARSF